MRERSRVAVVLVAASAMAFFALSVAAYPYRDLDYSCQLEAGPAASTFVHEAQLNEARGSWRLWPTRVECTLPTADGAGIMVVPIGPDLSLFSGVGALAAIGALIVGASAFVPNSRDGNRDANRGADPEED